MTVTDIEFLNAICREKFDAFTEKAFSIIQPGTLFKHNWHLNCIAEHLEAVHRGEIRRLIINEPPRSLKSVQVAQVYPAWVLGKQPNHQFIGVSYASKLSKRNVMQTRRLVLHEWYQSIFSTMKLATEAAEHFTTTMNGQYMGAGITGTATGFGADTLLLDDLLNPQEAASDTMRNSTNENMRNTFFSRYNDENTASTILIMQRVHDDDPTGNLMRDGGWHLLKLPAEAHKRIQIDLGDKKWVMEPGDLLFPARLSKETLQQKKLDLGSYNFAGQYDQEPVPLGGGEFKQHWIQYYQQGSIKPKDMNVCILVDQAGGEELNKKKKKLSDFTSIVVIGLGADNNYYVLDMVRDRFNPTDCVETIFTIHRHWNAICGVAPKVGVEQIGLMTTAHYLKKKMSEESYHFPLIPLGAGQRISKEERIRKLIPDMQNGRWYLPASLIYVDEEGRKWDLVRELIDVEIATFPKSRYDDMIDSISRVLDPEMSMLFPRPKVGMVQKAYKESAARSDNFLDW